MANILFLTATIPFPLSQGAALRVFNLAKELSKKHDCYLACMNRGESGSFNNLKQQNIFKAIKLLPAPVPCTLPRRFFRVSEENLNKLGRPAYYQKITQLLQQLVKTHNIDVVIAVTLKMAEFIDSISGVKKIIDDYDCVTLGLERQAVIDKTSRTITDKLNSLIQLTRVRNQEKKLTKKYDLITTISPADLATLQQLNRANSDSIHIVPNGVLLPDADTRTEEEFPNTIAFWGDLAFPPNKTAVQYFFTKIYRPYLEQYDIHWYIIGKNAGTEIQDMTKVCDNIVVTGFVEDLYALVRRIPIMINPMVIGSGLKNKVLEALILGRAVISTSMGVEALEIHNGVHYVCADTPADFYKETLRLLADHKLRENIGRQGYTQIKEKYSWSKVGDDFSSLITSLIK